MILFKKKNQNLDSKNIVAEIHNAIDSAQDKLLAEAKEILQNTTVPTIEESLEEKANLLNSLGFKNSIVSLKVEEGKQSAEKVKQLIIQNKTKAELITYYKTTYPFLKFLTEEAMEDICEKYNLIYSEVKDYIMDVPMKNLLEIKNCQGLRYCDSVGKYKIIDVKNPTLTKEDIENLKSMIIKGFYMSETPSRTAITYCFEKRIHNISGYICNRNSDITYAERGNGLYIAAPKSHFNLGNKKQISKHGYGEIQKGKDQEDPIVFRFVRGGVQVLTKWGLEANEESIVVETLN